MFVSQDSYIFAILKLLTLITLHVGVQSCREEVPVCAAADLLSAFPDSFPSRSINRFFNYKHDKTQFIPLVIYNRFKSRKATAAQTQISI